MARTRYTKRGNVQIRSSRRIEPQWLHIRSLVSTPGHNFVAALRCADCKVPIPPNTSFVVADCYGWVRDVLGKGHHRKRSVSFCEACVVILAKYESEHGYKVTIPGIGPNAVTPMGDPFEWAAAQVERALDEEDDG